MSQLNRVLEKHFAKPSFFFGTRKCNTLPWFKYTKSGELMENSGAMGDSWWEEASWISFNKSLQEHYTRNRKDRKDNDIDNMDWSFDDKSDKIKEILK